MKSNSFVASVDSDTLVLSSKSLLYKTDNFMKQTKYINNIDKLLSSLSSAILSCFDFFSSINSQDKDCCFSISTKDLSFSFLFRFGRQVDGGLNGSDIVFFEYLNNYQNSVISVDEFFRINKKFEVNITSEKYNGNYNFNKLYLISNVANVNFPRLNDVQKKAVLTRDKNVIVQGVAGSGKTNICIEKIIFTACQNYTGKTMYTTFSRGLLIDTRLKVDEYIKDLKYFLKKYQSKKIVFLDDNHKVAIENRLNINFVETDDAKIFSKMEKIINYLTDNVDYYLIEDIYKNKIDKNAKFVYQQYFLNEYAKQFKNYQIQKCFNRLSKYSMEVVYKEIYGMIFGWFKDNDTINKEDYINARSGSFDRAECEAIYDVAMDYQKHLQENNLIDNNIASRQLLKNKNSKLEYSVTIVDEVQDYTQVNLNLFKSMSLKLFCVGDALQMINPTYFSFGYLKNLLFDKDLTDVLELKSNYRNTKKITSVLNSLSQINKNEFGTHNFIIDGECVDSGLNSTIVYTKDNSFLDAVSNIKFDNFTFIVSNNLEKERLLKKLKNQEVLTVNEAKGLERNTIVLYNLLSSNSENWNILNQFKVNHKLADENSVYRYYYNLFYVGLSRAQQNIFVVENNDIKQFSVFFKNNFENQSCKEAIESLSKVVAQIDYTQEEIFGRIDDFLKLSQYDNARLTLNKIKDDLMREKYSKTIDIYEKFISSGDYRQAGIEFWKCGLIDNAKNQFTLSKDKVLIDLIDKCAKNNSDDLSTDIVRYYFDVKDNEQARNLIMETLKNDVNNLRNSFRNCKNKLKG